MSVKELNILLVEDDDVDAEAVKRSFSKASIPSRIFRAKDGEQALSIMLNNNSDITLPEPRLLLVDINLPRMDGMSLITELRNNIRLRGTVVFILTTSKSEEDKLRAHNLNVAGYMIKSNFSSDFNEMIQLLDHYRKSTELPYVGRR